jgi:hypothetical protein
MLKQRGQIFSEHLSKEINLLKKISELSTVIVDVVNTDTNFDEKLKTKMSLFQR